MSDEDMLGKIGDAADAMKGIVEAVPVYQDAIQPAAKEIGKALETVAKLVNAALAPISALVWGYDQIADFVHTRVAEKLKDIPKERIKTPSPLVVGPALEALRYAGHEEALREMYANLLATSMDSLTANNAHPAFVEIMRSMSSDEARIMRLFVTRSGYALIDVNAKEANRTGYEIALRNFSFIGREAGVCNPELTPNNLDNLCRLGLLEVPPFLTIADSPEYEMLEASEEIQKVKMQIESLTDKTFDVDKKCIRLTALGRQFCNVCVVDKASG